MLVHGNRAYSKQGSHVLVRDGMGRQLVQQHISCDPRFSPVLRLDGIMDPKHSDEL